MKTRKLVYQTSPTGIMKPKYKSFQHLFFKGKPHVSKDSPLNEALSVSDTLNLISDISSEDELSDNTFVIKTSPTFNHKQMVLSPKRNLRNRDSDLVSSGILNGNSSFNSSDSDTNYHKPKKLARKDTVKDDSRQIATKNSLNISSIVDNTRFSRKRHLDQNNVTPSSLSKSVVTRSKDKLNERLIQTVPKVGRKCGRPPTAKKNSSVCSSSEEDNSSKAKKLQKASPTNSAKGRISTRSKAKSPAENEHKCTELRNSKERTTEDYIPPIKKRKVLPKSIENSNETIKSHDKTKRTTQFQKKKSTFVDRQDASSSSDDVLTPLRNKGNQQKSFRIHATRSRGSQHLSDISASSTDDESSGVFVRKRSKFISLQSSYSKSINLSSDSENHSSLKYRKSENVIPKRHKSYNTRQSDGVNKQVKIIENKKKTTPRVIKCNSASKKEIKSHQSEFSKPILKSSSQQNSIKSPTSNTSKKRVISSLSPMQNDSFESKEEEIQRKRAGTRSDFSQSSKSAIPDWFGKTNNVQLDTNKIPPKRGRPKSFGGSGIANKACSSLSKVKRHSENFGKRQRTVVSLNSYGPSSPQKRHNKMDRKEAVSRKKRNQDCFKNDDSTEGEESPLFQTSQLVPLKTGRLSKNYSDSDSDGLRKKYQISEREAIRKNYSLRGRGTQFNRMENSPNCRRSRFVTLGSYLSSPVNGQVSCEKNKARKSLDQLKNKKKLESYSETKLKSIRKSTVSNSKSQSSDSDSSTALIGCTSKPSRSKKSVTYLDSRNDKDQFSSSPNKRKVGNKSQGATKSTKAANHSLITARDSETSSESSSPSTVKMANSSKISLNTSKPYIIKLISLDSGDDIFKDDTLPLQAKKSPNKSIYSQTPSLGSSNIRKHADLRYSRKSSEPERCPSRNIEEIGESDSDIAHDHARHHQTPFNCSCNVRHQSSCALYTPSASASTSRYPSSKKLLFNESKTHDSISYSRSPADRQKSFINDADPQYPQHDQFEAQSRETLTHSSEPYNSDAEQNASEDSWSDATYDLPNGSEIPKEKVDMMEENFFTPNRASKILTSQNISPRLLRKAILSGHKKDQLEFQTPAGPSCVKDSSNPSSIDPLDEVEKKKRDSHLSHRVEFEDILDTGIDNMPRKGTIKRRKLLTKTLEDFNKGHEDDLFDDNEADIPEFLNLKEALEGLPEPDMKFCTPKVNFKVTSPPSKIRMPSYINVTTPSEFNLERDDTYLYRREKMKKMKDLHPEKCKQKSSAYEELKGKDEVDQEMAQVSKNLDAVYQFFSSKKEGDDLSDDELKDYYFDDSDDSVDSFTVMRNY